MKKQALATHPDYPNHKLALCFTKDKWAFECTYKSSTIRSHFEYKTASDAQEALINYLKSKY